MVHVDAKVLRQVLDDTRSQLIAQSMLEDGNSKQEAEQETDNLLDIVSWFRDATFRLGMVDNQMQLRLQVNFDN